MVTGIGIGIDQKSGQNWNPIFLEYLKHQDGGSVIFENDNGV